MTRSHTIQGKCSQYLNKLNTERSIHLVQNPNEGMIYLIPQGKGWHQMARSIGLWLCTETKGGIGWLETRPYAPPGSGTRAGYFPQIFPTFFKKGCTNVKR